MFGINKTLKQKNLSKTAKSSGDKINKNVKDAASKKKSIVPDLIIKSYVEDCLVLGCIHDVSNTEIVVSLPGIGNFGFVKLNNISTIYTDLLRNESKDMLNTLSNMYSKGNLLRCKVLSYSNKRLNLTIQPDQVNSSLNGSNLEEDMIISGAVKTKEDHGYTIDLGIDELTGFFKTNNVELSIGQTCLFKIASKKSDRAITLKLCDSDSESSLFYEVKSRTKFDTYLPGAQLTCIVEKSGKNGLQAHVANQIYVYVHTNHLPVSKRANSASKNKQTNEPNANSSYANGDKITGTIIFINPYSKVAYLSLLPHLNDSTKIAKVASLFLDEEENIKLGQIIEDAQVSVHTYKGIYVKFKGQNAKTISGFIPKRELFDKISSDTKEEEDDEESEEENETKKSEKENLKKSKKDPRTLNKEELERLYPINTTLKARIYDYSLIEDIILLSMRPSVIEAAYMRYDELKLGQTVKCTIKSISPINGGVNVRLSQFITGFIPKIHTSDVPLSETLLPRKMKPGTEIKCKIIQLDSDNKRCVLTAKKTLIKSKLPLIDSFNELTLGMETYGVVVSIQKYGLLLGFLNDLKGLLPRNQISTSKEVLDQNKDLKDLYYIGQLIKCKVFELNRDKQQLKLSLLMDDNPTSKKAATKSEELPDFEIGDLIQTADILQVNEENCYFRVRLPRGKVNGIIYKNHLSDFDCMNDILFEAYKRTRKLSNLMITRYASDVTKNQLEHLNNHKMSHYLTMKTTLLDEYTNKSKNEIAKTLGDLQVNEWHSGWIKKILPNGLLVEMPYNLSGFASNQDIQYASEMKSSPNGLSIGQSVLIKIAKLTQDKNQFLASVRTRYNLTQTNSHESDYMIELFKSCLTSTKTIFNLMSTSKATQASSSGLVHPNVVANREIWQKAADKIKIGSVLKVAVKSFNRVTQQIECVFLDDLDKNFSSDLTGIAYATSSDEKVNAFNQGSKFDALVLAFDPVARVFCLTLDAKLIKTYKKNFDAKFSEQIVCKSDQLIKSEIVYVSDWFCIVGLRAHAMGRLAFMPLFRNHFTQLNTFNAEASLKASMLSLDSKIKKLQLVRVSSAAVSSLTPDENVSEKEVKFKKEDKEFLYYCTGQTGKVCVKLNVEGLDYLIVTHDLSEVKKNRKTLLRQLAVLNEKHEENGSSELKRKLADDNNEPVLVRKKLVLDAELHKRKLSNIKGDEDEADKDFIEIVADVKSKKLKTDKPEVANGSNKKSEEFPWEVTDFDMFNRVVNNLNGKDSENDSDDGDKTSDSGEDKKKKNKKKKKDSFVDDRKLHEIEERAFDPNRPPETVDDFERFVVASPNNSYLWIKFMAYHLQLGESDKARNVAKRALDQIHYREEKERLNVWVAWLNLENLYGSPESVNEIFQKAVQNCDSFKVHAHMAEIYSSTSKLQEAEDVYLKMTRKFNNLPETWIKYAIFHYKNSNCESARKILLRSLNSLDKREHVDIVNKFAQLEFKYGDVERAKTMYDSLLFTYPNRTDIWSVYIDLLVKHQKYDDTRHIFNRIVQLGLSAKRMKFIFKKYMDFEKAHGNEQLCDKVKEMAIKYVESNSSKKDTNDDDKQSANGSIESNLKKKLFN